LGCLYLYGLGTPQDYKEAIKWLRPVAEKQAGNLADISKVSQHTLGVLYAQGRGVVNHLKA
jgi:TPR repeat protein